MTEEDKESLFQYVVTEIRDSVKCDIYGDLYGVDRAAESIINYIWYYIESRT